MACSRVNFTIIYLIVYIMLTSYPYTGLDRTLGLYVPEFLEKWDMKMSKLSALCTSCLYPQGATDNTHFC